MVALLEFLGLAFLVLFLICICTLLIVATCAAIAWGIVAIKSLLAKWREVYDT